ncbi:MAG: sulfurtransferase [Polaromonas sp.]|nr:sulfurtransferase [Polaromonas sp.]
MKAQIRYMTGAALLGLAQWGWALQVPGPVVDGEWLAKNKAEVTVLDVRPNQKTFLTAPQFATDKKTGKKVLVELGGHIQDASPVQNSLVRVERTVGALKVKFMLPERADFEKLARNWGVQEGRPVVIVAAGQDPVDMNNAARLYWQFKVYGEDNIAIVNGGTAAWLAEGREITTAPTKVVEGDWAAKPERTEMLVTSENVEKAVAGKTAQLIDSRITSQYLGLSKKDSVFGYGHIPGAQNVSSELLTTEGDATRMLSVATYRDIYKASGVDPQAPAITYCNTGILAAGNWFVLSEILGNKQARLYDGSMHQWTLEKRALQAVARQ